MARRRVVWTADMNKRLRALRWGGMTWDGIAAAMNMGRNTVLERGRKIGARRQVTLRVAPEPVDRPARCAGHPETWGMLWQGLQTKPLPYPFQVFDIYTPVVRRTEFRRALGI